MDISPDNYNYILPEDRIAKTPQKVRHLSKLLLYNNFKISHHQFIDLPELLPEKSMLIFNDTKVIQARLLFKKPSGSLIEIFCLEPQNNKEDIAKELLKKYTATWNCLVGNLKRWKKEIVLQKSLKIDGKDYFLEARMLRDTGNPRLIEFFWNTDHTFEEIIRIIGEMPIPPYMKRKSNDDDKTSYQTIYAVNNGAVAAPTAGLHFTDEVFKKLENKGISKEFLTLHVSAGTFQPLKAENFIDHPMHIEQMVFTKNTIINLYLNSDQLISVGTTSLRSLESLYWFGVKLKDNPHACFFIEKLFPYQKNSSEISFKNSLEIIINYLEKNNIDTLYGNTEIMIMPGYRFHYGRGLITNFHQPNSTLLLLVSAFIGQQWKIVYKTAMACNYRFLSYGDSSLLMR